MDILLIFFNMMAYRVISLESPQGGDSNVYGKFSISPNS